MGIKNWMEGIFIQKRLYFMFLTDEGYSSQYVIVLSFLIVEPF